MIKKVQGNDNFLEKIGSLQAKFLLVGSYTKTAEIEGITVAGLPGFIEYTPALDMEVLYYGFPKSMPDIAKMPDGPPSPVLIASAVRQLCSLPLHFVDAGLTISPKAPVTKIDASYSDSIIDGAKIDAKNLFLEGKRYAQEILKESELFILGEVVPSGTTTAYAVTKALDYDCDGWFASSSAAKNISTLKRQVVDEALSKHISTDRKDIFEVLSNVGDTMQPFVAGMATVLSQKSHVVLGGGTQMAAVLAILKALSQEGENVNFENIALITTKWIVEDSQSDISALLHAIDPGFNAFYSDFDFSDSSVKNLRLYDEGYVKEGVAAGANIVYAYLNGVTQKQITAKVEQLYASFA